MADVTAERHAVFEAERIKKEYSELYSTLEKIRELSAEIRTPIQDMLLKMSEGKPLESRYAREMTDQVSDLMSRFDTAWIRYAELKDQITKK